MGKLKIYKKKRQDCDQSPSSSIPEHRHAVFSDRNFGRVDFLSYGPTKMDIITEIGTIRFLDGKAWFEAGGPL